MFYLTNFLMLFISVPGYISRSVAGSYDNEGIAIFALQFTYYLWVGVVFLHYPLEQNGKKERYTSQLRLNTVTSLFSQAPVSYTQESQWSEILIFDDCEGWKIFALFTTPFNST